MSGNRGSLARAARQPSLWRRLCWLAIAVVLVSASTARDSHAGPIAAWSLVGSMGQSAAIYQTALLLPDGHVLATDNQTASLYDPATGQWSPAGQLVAFHRSRYSLTLLTNGQVLLAGRSSSTDVSSEIYDPSTGSWRPTGPMLFPQLDAMTVRLADGRVLVAGGCFCPGTAVYRSEIYDPTTGTWHEAGELNVSREDGTATLLNNGKVLIAGGWSDNQGHEEVTATAELFDPVTETWQLTGSMETPREFQTATLLPDGQVLVTGGDDYDRISQTALSSAEIYNPLTGTWRTVAPMSMGRRFHTATLLGDGRVLVVGGENRAEALAGAEIYNPTENVWTNAGMLRFPRAAHQAVLLPDGHVLIVGGGNLLQPAPLTSTELFDPAALNAPDISPTITPTMTPEPTPSSTARPTPTSPPIARVMIDKVLILRPSNGGYVATHQRVYLGQHVIFYLLFHTTGPASLRAALTITKSRKLIAALPVVQGRLGQHSAFLANTVFRNPRDVGRLYAHWTIRTAGGIVKRDRRFQLLRSRNPHLFLRPGPRIHPTTSPMQ